MPVSTVIAIGVVFVLLLGEIDLSIGYVSGIAGVVVAELQAGGRSTVFAGWVAILIAVARARGIGLFQGSFVAYVGVPSFVVTLAFLLALQGVILKLIGDTGVIVIQDNTINNVANYFFSDIAGWVVASVGIAMYAFSALSGVVGRRRHRILSDNLILVAVRLTAVVAVIVYAVWWLNQDRGFPVVGLIVIVLLVFSLRREADDVRPPRLCRGRQRGGRTTRRHQHPDGQG